MIFVPSLIRYVGCGKKTTGRTFHRDRKVLLRLSYQTPKSYFQRILNAPSIV